MSPHNEGRAGLLELNVGPMATHIPAALYCMDVILVCPAHALPDLQKKGSNSGLPFPELVTELCICEEKDKAGQFGPSAIKVNQK